ncbi:adenylate kinase [Methanobrevibacter boviskoreani]|uniref:adenylate kinase n=1 Tax=Methanobrevibacter boviskoreani TaxID=1348249 RepID=UPI000593636D|nr:adenylate kinase [Methanobrevibacter boviskoreani]MDD6256430.1 adenylate kinase [Methanobrevibacter boviskoreani]
MTLVVLTGIPGSGSTTILNKTLEKVDYLHLNYGDVMTQIALDEGIVENRDQLRKLSPDTQKEIQKLAAAKISEQAQDGNVIVDTHCTISTPKGFLPGLPKWVLEELNPDLFILIEADPDEIIYRRLNDDSRERDIEKAKDIQLHQEMNRAASMAYATLTGATVKIIKNHDNHLPSTINKMVNLLE